MYKFLAIRIYNGHLTWSDIQDKPYFEKVKTIYNDLYAEEEEATDEQHN